MIAFVKNNKYIMLLIISIVFIKILSLFPEIIEHYYSNIFYLKISNLQRKITGLSIVSFGDILYILIVIYILFKLYKSYIKNQLNIRNLFKGTIKLVAIFYLIFQILWGINYHRIPLYQKMKIDYKEYTLEQLLITTDLLIEKSNQIHLKITQDNALKVNMSYSDNEIYQKSFDSYKTLAQYYPEFTFNNASSKNSMFSLPLTYMGFGGYFNPFTGEAQVNSLLPRYNFPTTSTHEMAHQIGYASETEANFIGYLASIHSKDIYFQYSGYTYALKYCLRNIEKNHPELLNCYLAKINPGIRENFNESTEFWEAHQTPIEVFFRFFYDNFLKANQQTDGIDTYSKFVGYLVCSNPKIIIIN